MRSKKDLPIVVTIKERCRSCYTCVRECPAKAIKISSAQAQVIADRCIACGNCVKVCRQNAKTVLNSIPDVYELLHSDSKVVALIAPSFPAEFHDMYYMKFIGMVRSIGFDYVCEVSFGADLVARQQRKFLEEPNCKHYISTTCPAVVGYVRRYHPHLIPYLSPIVSPMIAMARVVHELYGKDLKIVFIGPCIAKKGETALDEVINDVDEVLTFAELRQMFNDNCISPDSVITSEFDPPFGDLGAIFPLGHGMLQAAGIDEDLTEGDVVSANGRSDFIEAIREFESDDLHAKLVDVLCCNGCIMGAGMTTQDPIFKRRSRISRFTRHIVKQRDEKEWQANIEKFSGIDLLRTFDSFDQRIRGPRGEEIKKILIEMGKLNPEDELNCGACGYETCREHAIAIYQGFAEDKMCLPYTIEQLSKTISELDLSTEQLANTKEALRQSEKLAGMGQLAAGIAHELNNPLGVVLMYAHILLDELEQNAPIAKDLTLIVQEADRCKGIVGGLLNFARKNKVELRAVNLSELIDNCLKIIKVPDNISVKVEHQTAGLTADIDKDQIIQVLSNLINNAITAMSTGGKLTLRTESDGERARLIVADTGHGIPEEYAKKVFEPFFTTKQIGQGTGLGLAVTYGIIKMHRGDIAFETNSDSTKGPTGTRFIVSLPIHKE
jgi:signal transduction histidine kinase/iron only hydrogenase large subunit-like protein